MNALCSGLAVLGLCFPLPGHSLKSLEDAGWMVQDREQPSWFSSQVLAFGTYRVNALITGQKETVSSVLLMELRPEERGNDSPLLSVFKKICSNGKGGETCAVGGVSFERHKCMKGWALVPIGKWSEKFREECERYAPLFEDAPKK